MSTFSGENWARSCDREIRREIRRQDARKARKEREGLVGVKVERLTKAKRRK